MPLFGLKDPDPIPAEEISNRQKIYQLEPMSGEGLKGDEPIPIDEGKMKFKSKLVNPNFTDKMGEYDFATKEVDPNGKSAHDDGSKLDAGKPDLSLLLMFGRALTAVGAVGTFGAKKYTRGGWTSVPDGINRYTAALLRHLFKEDRESLDPDSGLLHASHAAWNSLARLEMILEDIENEHEAWERGY